MTKGILRLREPFNDRLSGSGAIKFARADFDAATIRLDANARRHLNRVGIFVPIPQIISAG